MKKLTRTICLTLAVLLGSTGTSWGADFNKGLVAAYESGDFATALREWRPLAEQGHADAQCPVHRTIWVVMYRKGEGVPQDYKTALKWYTLAAEQGMPVPRSQSGFDVSDQGQGVPQDYKTALKWYTLAAEQGDAGAHGLDISKGVPEDNLGLMYQSGLDVSG